MKTSWQQVRKEQARIGVFIRIQTYQRKERQVTTMGIAAVAALLVSITWTLQVVGAVQTEKPERW